MDINLEISRIDKKYILPEVMKENFTQKLNEINGIYKRFFYKIENL